MKNPHETTLTGLFNSIEPLLAQGFRVIPLTTDFEPVDIPAPLSTLADIEGSWREYPDKLPAITLDHFGENEKLLVVSIRDPHVGDNDPAHEIELAKFPPTCRRTSLLAARHLIYRVPETTMVMDVRFARRIHLGRVGDAGVGDLLLAPNGSGAVSMMGNVEPAPQWLMDELAMIARMLEEMPGFNQDEPFIDWTALKFYYKKPLDASVAVEPGPEPKKPEIKLIGSELPKNADQAEQALYDDECGETVLSHAGMLATVRPSKQATVQDRLSGDHGFSIFHYNDAALRERLMASATFLLERKGGWYETMPSHALIQTLMGRKGGDAPPLTGLLSAPTVTPTGRVISEPGYDSETGLYAAFEPTVYRELPRFNRRRLSSDEAQPTTHSAATATPEVDCDMETPVRLTAGQLARIEQSRDEEIEAALAAATQSYSWLVNELFAEFPFKDDIDRSAAIAAMLTGLVRKMCDLAPAFLFGAPQQSVGKTTLAQTIAFVVDGVFPGVNSWPESEEELDKVLLAALRSGQPTIVFDNLRNGMNLHSDKLAKILTANTYQGRILGVSELITLPSNVLVLLTGNNITLDADMPSRIIDIYLDAQNERPDQRKFKRDIFKWSATNRAEIIQRALTIIKAYMDADSPPVSERGTRYATWDAMVRYPIIWAGGEDVAGKFDRAHDNDPSLADLRELLRNWHEALGREPLTAGEILAKVEERPGKDFPPLCFPGDLFCSALEALAYKRPGAPLLSRTVGTALARHANRMIDGCCVVGEFDSHRKQKVWSLQQAPGHEAAIAPVTPIDAGAQ